MTGEQGAPLPSNWDTLRSAERALAVFEEFMAEEAVAARLWICSRPAGTSHSG